MRPRPAASVDATPGARAERDRDVRPQPRVLLRAKGIDAAQQLHPQRGGHERAAPPTCRRVSPEPRRAGRRSQSVSTPAHATTSRAHRCGPRLRACLGSAADAADPPGDPAPAVHSAHGCHLPVLDVPTMRSRLDRLRRHAADAGVAADRRLARLGPALPHRHRRVVVRAAHGPRRAERPRRRSGLRLARARVRRPGPRAARRPRRRGAHVGRRRGPLRAGARRLPRVSRSPCPT